MADTSFPQFITDRRRELELTLGDVASNIGVSPITVSNWSNGESIPKKENLVALASVLEFPAEELAEMAGVKLAPDPEPVADAASETLEAAEEEVVDEVADEDTVTDSEEAVVGIPTIGEPAAQEPAAEEANEESVAGVVTDQVEAAQATEEEKTGVIDEAPEPPETDAAVETTPPPEKLEEPPPVPESGPDVIPRVAVSGPPPTQLSPLTYVQDPQQLLRYRIRWGITTVALIIMAFVLVWALGELFTALSDVKESVTP